MAKIRLNLGCGNKLKKEFINIDNREIIKESYKFLKHDCFLPLPYEDNTIDEIEARHFLEHISHRKIDEIFLDWIKKLKIGGSILISVPNTSYYIDKYINKKWNCEKFSYHMYGGQDYSGNFHYNCFDETSLKRLFKKHKLKVVEFSITKPFKGRVSVYKIKGVK